MDILETIPKAPKIIEKPKAQKIITKIGSSRKNGYMNFDVGVFRSILSPLEQFEYSKLPISDFLRDTLKQMHGIKLNITLDVIFMNVVKDTDENVHFIMKAKEIITKTSLFKYILRILPPKMKIFR